MTSSTSTSGDAPRRAPPSGLVRGLQRTGDFLRAVRLDDVADLEIVEVLDADTALETLTHLRHVVLEAAERRDDAVVDLGAVTNDAHAGLAIDDAVSNEAPGDYADARNLEQLAHLGFAADDFPLLRPQQTLERGPNIGHRLVDDLVELDVDAFALGRGARVVVGPHVEADDDRPRRAREENVALRDRAD